MSVWSNKHTFFDLCIAQSREDIFQQVDQSTSSGTGTEPASKRAKINDTLKEEIVNQNQCIAGMAETLTQINEKLNEIIYLLRNRDNIEFAGDTL